MPPAQLPVPEPQAQTIAAIDRATDVLALFADTREPTLGVTEIATALNLSKAVVYRILSSFRAKGFVELDEATRRYSLGPRVLHLGLSYVRRTDAQRLARPHLERLSNATDETATLSLKTNGTRVYIDQVTPIRDVKMVVRLGQAVPLHAGASSKAFLAFLEPDEREGYLSGSLAALTAKTITDVRALRRELDQIRERGYALSAGERVQDAASIAAPVYGFDGRPAAVISLCGPAERFRDRAPDVADLLLEATGQLSHQLGYVPEEAG